MTYALCIAAGLLVGLAIGFFLGVGFMGVAAHGLGGEP